MRSLDVQVTFVVLPYIALQKCSQLPSSEPQQAISIRLEGEEKRLWCPKRLGGEAFLAIAYQRESVKQFTN